MRSPIFLTDLMEEIGVTPSIIRAYPDAIWMTAEVRDWGRLLRSIGIDDEVLANHLRRWMNGNFEVGPTTGVQFFHLGSLPLPKSCIDEEEFLRRYGTGDELRDAVLITALSRYDPSNLKASILEVIGNQVKTFLDKGEKNEKVG